ncbi:MAG: SDR family oxidoreductase [Actinomycetia bacterium]|nr:SDR family oxidoreductase [Actinomycetes bacterium]
MDFANKIAVVTGGGDGMGRALARQLAAEGCHVAVCDLFPETAAETKALCEADAPTGTRITSHECDVSSEDQIIRFRDEVATQHETDHVNLIFNNAGIGGGGTVVNGDREEWERTFNVCWYGVYYSTRAFLPMLVASSEGRLVNTSSVNGFWASIGPDRPHSAYSAAKFAVKGFSEALIGDLRANAPHVGVSVVMPGHIGTGIATNSMIAHGDELDPAMLELAAQFRNSAPTTADQAATIILDGVRNNAWRILIGDDAFALDVAVRDAPEEAYDLDFVERLYPHFSGIPQEDG